MVLQTMKIAEYYDKKYVEIHRPKPLTDNKIESLIKKIMSGVKVTNIDNDVHDIFKQTFETYLKKSNLNNLSGFEYFQRKDICIGCTQFIDNIYMYGKVQTIEGDYKYHERLGLSSIRQVGDLIPEMPLIISMPFPSTGDIHHRMEDILKESMDKNIPIHIDGAWITCSRDISFDFNHPNINSFAISLSKGLGLGWNRIAVRWQKEFKKDSITIMNDYNMVNKSPTIIGQFFLENLEPDHLWNTHYKNYDKICRDFKLTPTKSIYIALDNNQPVGISPLIRYLEKLDVK
jgi:hypothetical protein